MQATSYASRRIIDASKKQRFCELVRDSYSLEEAAEQLDVSLRTVQRERQRDEAFDRDVRAAQQSHPNPLLLMESAARTHWRAAAWLLERERPDRFGRRRANTARKHEVEAALDLVLEAALAATPPEQRAALYQPVVAAVEQAFHKCFPQPDRCESPKHAQFPATPLADEAAEAVAELSPKIAEATDDDTKPNDATAPKSPRNTARLLPAIASPHSSAAQLSPKIEKATPSNATSTDITTRRKQRQLAKQEKAAKKRAAASRRRNAG
ncbi:hypothetical protein [Lacipirellula parvula]|uniref:Transposase IS30-like HTH domain-containing protein n=1 Tax=Lacipirellula parvula TaxID=2650471 RepID=A0A5K7X2Z3_9BACT|nr:hypothetical protein [Lacipirellula parvula]BBO31028.1 hypothetical protein PLANPX_0640 [Lacipirellula parvula]